MAELGKVMTDLEFLESMSKCDEAVECEDNCGLCENQRIMAQTARDLLASNEISVQKWSEESKRRWQDTKYFKFYHECLQNGVDPHTAFEERGWEM